MKRPLLVGLVVVVVGAISWIAADPNHGSAADRTALDRLLQPASLGPRSSAEVPPPEDRLPQQAPAPSPTPVDSASRPSTDSRPSSAPSAPAPRHDYLPDRVPDEIRADGTHVYHNYPFQMKQPDGSFATVPVTVCFTPVPAAPVLPSEAESTPPR
jgi:hypothetical protein